MKKRYVKIAACTMAATLTFTGMGFDVNATGNIGSVLPSSGIDFSLQGEENSTSLSSLQPQAELFSFSPEKKLGYFPAVKVLRPSSGPLHSWC